MIVPRSQPWPGRVIDVTRDTYWFAIQFSKSESVTSEPCGSFGRCSSARLVAPSFAAEQQFARVRCRCQEPFTGAVQLFTEPFQFRHQGTARSGFWSFELLRELSVTVSLGSLERRLSMLESSCFVQSSFATSTRKSLSF